MKTNSFYTKTALLKDNIDINHNSSFFLIGSCFTENIGNKLRENKFPTIINPSGILYNPISIAKTLERVIDGESYSEKDLFQFGNKWVSFDHHGSFSAQNQKEALEKINNKHVEAHKIIKNCDIIIISLGSAWVYEYEGTVVANCHKIASKHFVKRLLSVKEVIEALEKLIGKIKRLKPTVKVIFTVSPVRHIREGLHENNISKSTLHLAIKNSIEGGNNFSYFPSYELIIDELRDYRFFKDDLIHPTEMAINYVWEKFIATYCDETTKGILGRLEKIIQAINHIPFNFESKAHQQFIAKQKELMDNLSKEYPFLDFKKEQEQLIKPKG